MINSIILWPIHQTHNFTFMIYVRISEYSEAAFNNSSIYPIDTDKPDWPKQKSDTPFRSAQEVKASCARKMVSARCGNRYSAALGQRIVLTYLPGKGKPRGY